MATLVTIRGTWSRTNTSRWEVYDYRRLVRNRFRILGGDAEINLPRDQKDENVDEDGPYGTKSGAFKVTVPLRGYHHANRKTAQIAKLVAQAILAKALCRGPQLQVDVGRTTVAYKDGLEGIL